MARRYNTRRIKKHHNYSFEQAADLLGVHEQTVRGWARAGLRCMTHGRPFLILGADLAAFLERRAVDGKRPLAPNELYCLKCKTGRTPAAMIADYVPHGPDRGRLSGICPECESMCQRFVRRDRIGVAAPDLAIEIPSNFRPQEKTSQRGGGGVKPFKMESVADGDPRPLGIPRKKDSATENLPAAPEDLKEPGEAA